MGKPFTLVAMAVLALPTAVAASANVKAAPWRDEPAVTALFRDAGVDGTFVLLDEGRGELRGHNRKRAEQRFVPASTFKVASALIGLSVGAVQNVDALIPYKSSLKNPTTSARMDQLPIR